MNALTSPQTTGFIQLASQTQGNIQSAQAMLPQSFEQALVMAEHLAKSGLVPAGLKDNPSACLVVMQHGASLGLSPFQAVQNITFINGKPCLYGDIMLALVKASPACEWVKEEVLEDGTAICTVKRRSDPEPQSRRFTWAQAERAGLTKKAGPWQQYPERMLQFRARSLALRDVFPDLLFGFQMEEEIRDITPADNFPPSPALKTLPDYPQEKLESLLPQWQQSGKAPEQIISMVSSKYQLTDAQKAQILALADKPENQAENNDATD